MRFLMTAMFCVAAAATSQAQGEPGQREPAIAMPAAEFHVALDGGAQNLRAGVESRTTRSAPYSAEAVTESVQQLADGNRIVSKNATRIFRDAEGRTRREQLNASGAEVLSINISDPGAGTSYVLDPVSHVAYRNQVIFTRAAGVARSGVGPGGASTFEMSVVTPDGASGLAAREREARPAAETVTVVPGKQVAEIKARVEAAAVAGAAGAGGTTTFVSGGGGFVTSTFARVAEGAGKTTHEELGQQTIEGVTATGTRAITEIAAGAIGNEQPIKIVSEQWFSPELQVLVMTKHSDPRVGETVYRLTGIVRAEPARSLFELPADYTLKESEIRRLQR